MREVKFRKESDVDNLMWCDLIRNNEDKIADEIYGAYCDQATFGDIDPDNFILIIKQVMMILNA